VVVVFFTTDSVRTDELLLIKAIKVAMPNKPRDRKTMCSREITN